jgi:glycosyltransferase involved in cell wall biosynthesis
MVDGLELEVHGAALGELERRHRRELDRFGMELGDAVPRAEIPGLFARADVLVNNMRAGAPDKVVYEAAASCLPVLASNPVFDELFGELPLSFARDDPAALAERLRWLVSLPVGERAEIGRTLRERVVARHSVESWADGVLAAVR